MLWLAQLAAAMLFMTAHIVPVTAGVAQVTVQTMQATVPPAPKSRAKFQNDEQDVVDGLAYVNKLINDSIVYVTDAEQYGQREMFVMLPESGKGDCEDYALTKMWVLFNAGYPTLHWARLQSIMVTERVVNKDTGKIEKKLTGHMVLEVKLPSGEIAVMDNNHDDLMTRRELEARGYEFIDWD